MINAVRTQLPHDQPAREKTINVTSPTFLRSSKYYITQSTFRGGNDSTITTQFRRFTLMQIIQHRSKSRIRILFKEENAFFYLFGAADEHRPDEFQQRRRN